MRSPSSFKFLLPAIILMAVLLIIGFVLEALGQPIFWSGYIAMIFFYGVIFALGLFAGKARKTDTADELMLAGRSIPLWIAIFTMSATWVGGGYINGTAESTSSSGLAWVQAPWGYALSLIIGGIFFARKMRRHEFKTLLDPFARRFGERVGAILFFPALFGEIFWTAAILTALGTTFGTVLGVDFTTAIIISAIIAIAYTAIGGLWAVALTDVVQMGILLVGLILVIPFAMESAGGFEAVSTKYFAEKGTLGSFAPPWRGWEHPDWGNSYFMWWDYTFLLIFGGIPWQVYFQRVLAAKNEKTAMWLSILAGGVCLIAAVPAIMIGMVGATFDWGSLGMEAPEAALTLPMVVRHLTPPMVATIGLGAIAAAVMSSVDSSILSASSMAGWNVYRPLVKKDATPEQLSKVIRRLIWIVGIAATIVALQIKSVYTLWFLCSDFVYCILFPQLVMALFDKKANRIGALAGLAVSLLLRAGGGEAEFGIPNLIPFPMVEEGVVMFPFRTLAMLGGLLTIPIVSRLTGKWAPPVPLKEK